MVIIVINEDEDVVDGQYTSGGHFGRQTGNDLRRRWTLRERERGERWLIIHEMKSEIKMGERFNSGSHFCFSPSSERINKIIHQTLNLNYSTFKVKQRNLNKYLTKTIKISIKSRQTKNNCRNLATLAEHSTKIEVKFSNETLKVRGLRRSAQIAGSFRLSRRSIIWRSDAQRKVWCRPLPSEGAAVAEGKVKKNVRRKAPNQKFQLICHRRVQVGRMGVVYQSNFSLNLKFLSYEEP